MCLKVFVSGHDNNMKRLKVKDMIGICFSKVNFLRDLKDDNLLLNRNYFPGVDPSLMKMPKRQSSTKSKRF
jgi:phytoene/squalene synthetase